MQHYYVILKENHTLNLREVEQIRKMELPTPEDRWPEDNIESPLIEVFKKGTKQQCEDFRNNIEGDDLKNKFEIKKL